MIIVNPGTGAVPNATFELAEKVIETFTAELGEGIEIVPPSDKHGQDGYFPFVLRYDGNRCHVDVPGIELEKVQYRQGDNPFAFQRLYVGGNSWLWSFALKQARSALFRAVFQVKVVCASDAGPLDLEAAENAIRSISIDKDGFSIDVLKVKRKK